MTSLSVNPASIIVSASPALVGVSIESSVQANVVRVIYPGPQGAKGNKGDPGDSDLTNNTTVDMLNVVNGSTLVYDSTRSVFVADANTTIAEIVNGGNF